QRCQLPADGLALHAALAARVAAGGDARPGAGSRQRQLGQDSKLLLRSGLAFLARLSRFATGQPGLRTTAEFPVARWHAAGAGSRPGKQQRAVLVLGAAQSAARPVLLPTR